MRVSLLLVSLLGGVSAQLNAGTPGIYAWNSTSASSRLCNSTFNDANITEVISFDPQVGAEAGNIDWAATVYQTPDTTGNNSVTELSLWFSPGDRNFSDNFALGYDVCYLWISDASLNTISRGQDDVGDCLATLDDTCVNDFDTLTQQFSSELVSSPTPGPNSNLSTNSLPKVCEDLAQMLTDNFPKSCEVFFSSSRTVYGAPPLLGGPLTGPQSLLSRTHCSLNDTYTLMWSQLGNAAITTYYTASWFVTPIITAFMPVADVARPVTLAFPKSIMTCLRAKNIKAGSQTVPPAGAPTPIDTSTGSSNSSSNSTAPSANPSSSSSLSNSNSTATVVPQSDGLSSGAIAGVAVAATLGGICVIGLLAYLIFRKRMRATIQTRKNRKGSEKIDESNGSFEMEPDYRPVTAAESTGGLSEVDGSERWAELPEARKLPTSAISEMSGSHWRRELPGTRELVELPAQNESVRGASRSGENTNNSASPP